MATYSASRELARLTPRLLEVAALIADAKTNWEIAAILGISEQTVKNHVARLMVSLDVSSRIAIAKWYWDSYGVCSRCKGSMVGIVGAS